MATFLEKKAWVIRISLIATGIAFIIFGIYRGEAESVLAKGIRICMECIGIG